MVEFSSETVEAKRQWNYIFQVLNEKKRSHQPRNIYPMKISFKNEEKQFFLGNQKLGIRGQQT